MPRVASGQSQAPTATLTYAMSTPPLNAPRARERSRRTCVSLRDLLGAVATAGETRVELVCWQLGIDDCRVRPAWDVALRTGLLEATRADRLTGQTLYRLSARGRRALLELSRRRRPDGPAVGARATASRRAS
jgi:hypothetical protein